METENSQQKVNQTGNLNQDTSPTNPIANQRGNFLLIIGIIVLVLVIGVGGYYLGAQKNIAVQNTGQKSLNMLVSSPSPKLPPSAFQNLLSKNCIKDTNDKVVDSVAGTIDLAILPLALELSDLQDRIGNCNVDRDKTYSSYVSVPLGGGDEVGGFYQSFFTISDKYSSHCCHGPSSLVPAGKPIKSVGEISVYIHTGTWGEGPNSGYKPIIIRGVKTIKLSTGEEIRVVLDRKALDKNDTDLQKIEDKYQIIDPNFDSGAKVSTPETVEKMLMDSFFSNLSDSPVVKKVEIDLQSISLKN